MIKKRQYGIRIVSLVMFTLLLTLGCSRGLRFHDESRATVATAVKEKYTQADVAGVIEVEKKNLDNLLAEELKVVRDNHKLQVDFALLSIADDNTPMAATYTKKASGRLKELGYTGGFKQLRVSLLGDVDLIILERSMQENSELIKSLTDVTPPPCGPKPPKDFPAPLSENIRDAAENFYRLYREACIEFLKSENQPPSGQIKQALDEWQSAEGQLGKMDQSIDEAQKEVKDKSDAYNKAVKEVAKAKASGKKLEEDLEGKAASLLQVAKDAADFVGAKSAAEERVKAIIVLLTAAAGGKIDTSDPKVAKAATVAKEIPSLAGDIKGLVEQAQAPSVNNLLIEMRHQVLLLGYAKQLRTLAQQRVDILKTKYAALKEETRYWLNFGDAICSYAVLSAGKDFPGELCDDFSVASDGKNCRLGNSPAIQNCTLGKPWNDNIQSQANNAATRELYKALAAYLQALAVPAIQNEQTFRLIDVRHRETLASRESAIRGWDNLVAVPINQLYAYYQAGLKPAEIADLIVKALGFTAITAGVSQ